MSQFRIPTLLLLSILLSGCNAVVLDPSGDIAGQQRDLLVASTLLMLLVIVPVIALIVLFAWHYRQSNTEARYEPDWSHSIHLELVIWAAPLLIIVCLGALTWMGTHLLDPYRPLDRAAEGRSVPADAKPLDVDVVALDWKWLFIYPEYGIATVNELAAPVDRPISFRITSSSVMNSFYIPALAGQIYAMPGMETKLHAIVNKAGTYEGFSANYSGAGFSGMRFAFRALSDDGFAKWTDEVKASGVTLGRTDYLALERPSENEPVRKYASVEADLFKAIVNMCVEPGKMCISDMAAIDAKGGLGMAGINNVLPLTYDKYARRGSVLGPEQTYVAAICDTGEQKASAPANMTPVIGKTEPRSSSTPSEPPSTTPVAERPS